jgi:hypothetical protein
VNRVIIAKLGPQPLQVIDEKRNLGAGLIRTSGVESKDARSWRQTAPSTIESRAMFDDNDGRPFIRWLAVRCTYKAL